MFSRFGSCPAILCPVAWVCRDSNVNVNGASTGIWTVKARGSVLQAMGVPGQRKGRSIVYRSSQEVFQSQGSFGAGYCKIQASSGALIV